MHDIETINRINARAVGDEARRARAAGWWTCTKYDGLNALGFSKHLDLAAANAEAERIRTSGELGVRAVINSPIEET